MTYTSRGAVTAVSLALLATVATQLFYVGVISGMEDGNFLRRIVWTTEMAMFTLVAVAALPLANGRGPNTLAWSAVAISGIMNVIQVGMGLSEFPQAMESPDGQVFQTVLNGAFFLYFHAKALVGLAAIGLGLAALQGGTTLGKVLGGLSILAGLAAAGLNLLGMANGMEMTFPAGAAGTAATALLALTALTVLRNRYD
ncbi:hypothetical protein [Parerythrobacter jejuensis]|uniref:Thiamine biosynthesis protein ThiC n=1 Tax=Parerythrobacter jejuensis TaxID=795812 RepID=A0A845ARU4_9SPHN|nr:hypothetical protein [Parerythrobacter jejuensis]MXP32209.1 hypothetical protein [Parerythrobacter jejuensis]